MRDHELMTSGLDFIIETLGMRYEYDENGRIVRARDREALSGFPPHPGTDSLPLFVLGRAVEGCVWRFSANLSSDRVIDVARLAARELGFRVRAGTVSPQPDRLVMIEGMLVPDASEPDTSHEILTRGGMPLAELWTIR